MELIPTKLEGCYQVRPFFAQDERGTFVKTFHAERFSALGLPTVWCEEFYSSSRKGVIRGMHFQTPPHDHEKLVYCMQGRVLDVVVDLRKGSPTYGRHLPVELDASSGHGLLIPKGMAHGFLALDDDVLMAYKVTSAYAPANDAGISWDSFGLDWGIDQPIVSMRDRAHPALADFDSPF
ncbi:dTDP-4-dehydrorhamnose 3,5-epimerase [Paucibacter sp. KCTC 42545]|uniref:dTDP-4-dehydrorhamnose 3,5-epimerase n=1 Tax=Paucibacter sp. KCTC 42545 TaxID=1768242 RepID=UPI000733BE64|nr:dTDP-4-dehydrorhamnose 3,5-epimerase [Paucibacter sp. KCTC 42545]ALT76195.1 dTDP-4-dehydrorhamnose 3,5-epimerase [Paucibacter sp. KCTC 42545]